MGTPYLTHIRTVKLDPKTITERIHGTNFTATVTAHLTVSRLRDGRFYLSGQTWRNGQLVECYGCGGETARAIFERHTGTDIRDVTAA